MVKQGNRSVFAAAVGAGVLGYTGAVYLFVSDGRSAYFTWKRTQCSPRPVFRELADVSNENNYTPTPAEQKALNSGLGAWAKQFLAALITRDTTYVSLRIALAAAAGSAGLNRFAALPHLGAWIAAYVGYEGWSDVTDYCILRRVLELRDSPLAGECAAIIKAHRPDARLDEFFGPAGASGLRIAPHQSSADSQWRGAPDMHGAPAGDAAAEAGLRTQTDPLSSGWPAGNDGAADGMFDGMFAREPPGEAAGGGLPGQEDLTEQDDFGLREGVASDGHRNRRRERREERRARQAQSGGWDSPSSDDRGF